MSWLHQTFTPTEAAALVRLSPKQVRKELEYAFIPAPSPPRLPFSVLVYFETLRLSGLSLAVEDRAKLFLRVSDALTASPAPESVEFAAVFSLRLGSVVRELDAKLVRWNAWKHQLVTDANVMAGETVFPDSRLTVRHVGEMLERGESPDVILEDYPYLSPEDLEFSRVFVKAYPRVGRPSRGHQAPH